MYVRGATAEMNVLTKKNLNCTNLKMINLTTTQSKLTPVCEHCFQPYPSIDAPKHKDGKCNEICVNCGTPVHPNVPCSEVIMFHNQVDEEYFDILRLILEEGTWKKNRTGVDTLGVFGAQAKFTVDLDAFPILTTKKVWFKGIVHELLWFLRGDTNIKYLVDNDVHIWDEWAYQKYISYLKAHPDQTFESNPTGDLGGNRWRSSMTQEQFIAEIKADKNFATYWGDLGMGTYGGMWRNFPYFYQPADDGTYNEPCPREGHVDQIKKVLDKLKSNPDDRRMIVSAWHPYWVDHCALPPCHCMFHFNTEELTFQERAELAGKSNWGWVNKGEEEVHREFDERGIPRRRLNLLLYQRSCDAML